MSAHRLKWGVLGATSTIYRNAVGPALEESDAARIVALASRSGAPPDRRGTRGYRDYADLLADEEVEAVYIPLPNQAHEEWTLRAAAAGKHVLCEKPLAPDADAARRMADACAAAGVVLFEAYMTPFHPRSVRWDALVADGAVGTPLHAAARFSFPHADPADHRWLPGGGALLDVGIYCLEPLLAAGGWRPGQPLPRMAAAAVSAASGVDATFSGWLAFPSGFTASFVCSFDAPEAQRLEVVGTGGTLLVEPAFTPQWDDRSISRTGRDGRTEVVRTAPGAMYREMVTHFADVVRGTAPPMRPPAAAIALADVVDALRAAAGGAS